MKTKEKTRMSCSFMRAGIALEILLTVLVLYCQHIQLIYSASVRLGFCLKMDVRYQLLNMMIASIPFLISFAATEKNILSLGISSAVITLLGLANYHVFLYHGTPFLASDIYSLTATLNVLSGYRLVFDNMVIRLLLIAFVETMLILFTHRIEKRFEKRKNRKYACGILGLDLVLIWLIFLSGWTLFPSSLVSWSWVKPMQKYGYEVCLANSIHTVLNKYTTMDGYDADILQKYVRDRSESASISSDSDYPDIILILNESLCDLNRCSGIPEGEEVLEPIRQIPGLIQGYTTVPLIGGGTNCSEYELLTSNSCYEISVASPFAAFDMGNVDNIACYLKSLGYTSSAMHCFSDVNYARNIAYPAMGFDEVILGPEEYTFREYGNRKWLDEDNFKDLLSFYERQPDQPRFMYLLTYQNHGGYEQNSEEYDTIHVSADFGDLTDDVNEYLTSIQSSSEAFASLISELSDSDRPVIVLTVGDHAPSFIAELPSTGNNDKAVSIAQRTVPYYVWTNIDLETYIFSSDSTLTDLMPMVLRAVGIPLSPFYELINELHEAVPIRTSDGIYINNDGNEILFGNETKYDEMIRDYYYMEYNTITHREGYIAQLFTCP